MVKTSDFRRFGSGRSQKLRLHLPAADFLGKNRFDGFGIKFAGPLLLSEGGGSRATHVVYFFFFPFAKGSTIRSPEETGSNAASLSFKCFKRCKRSRDVGWTAED